MKEGGDVDRHEETLERLNEQRAEIEQQMQAEFETIKQGADPMAEDFEKVQVKLKKTNINLRMVTLAWKP